MNLSKILLVAALLCAITTSSYCQTSKIEDQTEKCKKYLAFCTSYIDATIFDALKVAYGTSKVKFKTNDIEGFLDGNIRGSLKEGLFISNAWVTASQKKSYFFSIGVDLDKKVCVVSALAMEGGFIYELELEEIPLSKFKDVPGEENNSFLVVKSTKENTILLTADYKLLGIAINGNNFNFDASYQFKQ